jgi:putative membrane protein
MAAEPGQGESAKQQLAEERTDFAEDRTILANERTYAGWMRTGLAAVGVGVGFNALFATLQPAWIPKAIATLLLVVAIFIFVAAERRACAILSRLKAHEVEAERVRNLRLITAGLILATVALIAAFWLLEMKAGAATGGSP